MSTFRGFAIVLAATAMVAAHTGCVADHVQMPIPVYSPTGVASDDPTNAAVGNQPVAHPILRPGGTAAQNQQFFDAVMVDFYVKNGLGTSVGIVNNLAANGFTKADMEVTPETTTLGIPADAVIVSVKMQGECLIGQVNGEGYHGVIAPVLATGKCLVGETVPIDF